MSFQKFEGEMCNESLSTQFSCHHYFSESVRLLYNPWMRGGHVALDGIARSMKARVSNGNDWQESANAHATALV
jgi:hypothetical protein